jgi:TPR repeat protein
MAASVIAGMTGCRESLDYPKRYATYKAEVDKITDQKQLAQLAEEPPVSKNYDPYNDRRKLAVEKITDQSVLIRVATHDIQPLVRVAAIKRLTDQPTLAEIAIRHTEGGYAGYYDYWDCPGPYRNVSWYAVCSLHDQALLAKVAIEAPGQGATTRVLVLPGSSGSEGYAGLGGQVWAMTAAVAQSGGTYSIITPDGRTVTNETYSPHLEEMFTGGYIANREAIERLFDRSLLAKVEAESKVAIIRDYVTQRLLELPAQENLIANATAGDVQAQMKLGDCYNYGKGGARDKAEAMKWYNKAAAQNYAPAQYRLGDEYNNNYTDFYSGISASDRLEAVKWYRKAAEQDYAPAEYALYKVYSWGEGVAKDSSEAINWARKAAEQNYAPAQATLSGWCAFGNQQDINLVEAYMWVLLAVAQEPEYLRRASEGDEKTLYRAVMDFYNLNGLQTRLRQKMSPEQIAEGKKRADNFQPRSQANP